MNRHAKGDWVSHRYDHYDLGVILEVNERLNRYIVQWDQGPVLDYPGFILKPTAERGAEKLPKEKDEKAYVGEP